jgi:pimeloyl-ACP methyl ester carboxylesterase
MVDLFRRRLLKTGAAATAVAAASSALGQQRPQGDGTAFFERNGIRIRYQDGGGKGFPLLILPGGGLNSALSALKNPFDTFGEFQGEYRCIAADLRNANTGQSTGPVEPDRSWDSHTDDQLALMDHLGIKQFAVMGFCIGGPFIWNLLKRAPTRIVAAVPAQPVGFRPEAPDVLYDVGKAWAVDFLKRRPEVPADTVERYITNMFRKDADFVFTVSRDFVRSCQTPVLICPDDVPAHPFAVAMEVAQLAPKSEVSLYPWKLPPERIPIAIRQIKSFLKAHRPATT